MPSFSGPHRKGCLTSPLTPSLDLALGRTHDFLGRLLFKMPARETTPKLFCAGQKKRRQYSTAHAQQALSLLKSLGWRIKLAGGSRKKERRVYFEASREDTTMQLDVASDMSRYISFGWPKELRDDSKSSFYD